MTSGTLAGQTLCPGYSPDKNTGVGHHFLLQWIPLDPGMEPRPLALQVNFLPSEPPGTYMQLGEEEFSDWGVNSGSHNRFSGTDQT